MTNGGTSCKHPVSDSRVEVVEKRSDGTRVLQATCSVCAQTSKPEPMTVQYRPDPVQIGFRWFAMVDERGELAICGLCGRPIFIDFHPNPIIAFIHDEEGFCVGQVDLCRECGLKVLEE